MFCEGVFSSSSTYPAIRTFAASILITMAAIHLLLCCFNINGGRERKRHSRYGVLSSCLAYAAIRSTFAASIVIIMAAIHLLLFCFNGNGGTERKRYDVFLSFRGRDVRRGFVDHLYHALTDAGFRVFLDTHHLQRGRDISASLQHAIEASRILIPIFSSNYAESAWCLREVALIARRVQENGKTKKGSAIAVPLFYNVTPSQVRHPDQSHGSPFSEAFEKHESSGSLFTLSNLSGWSLQEDTNGYEAAMVKRVLQYLGNTLRETDRHISINTAGLVPITRDDSLQAKYICNLFGFIRWAQFLVSKPLIGS